MLPAAKKSSLDRKSRRRVSIGRGENRRRCSKTRPRACLFFKGKHFCCCPPLPPVCYHHRCQSRKHLYLCKYYGGLREECARVSLPLSVCKEFIALLLMKIFFVLFSPAGPRSRKVKKPGEKTERVSTGEKRPRTAFSSEQLAR